MATIRSVIKTILNAVPGSITEETVDTFKAGDPSQAVTGIVTTFLASQAVLQKAVELGANLVITHEPTFYNHLDQVDWLENDPVYQAKLRFITENNLAIWRFHDNWHIHHPDGLITGIVNDLGWQIYADAETPELFHLPPVSLKQLALTIKDRLGIRTLRTIGDPELVCRRAGILVGAWGGVNHINFLGKVRPDVLIVGEIAEWETSEYVRDANTQGARLGLIIAGHANSEEPGMKYLVEWLQPRLPGIPIYHVPVTDAFTFI